jgi:putative sterol carrier protein
MPHSFPSAGWVADLERQINSDEEYANVASTWEGDLNFVIENIPGLDTPMVIYVDLWHGKCRDARFADLASAPDARFKINAPLANWKRVIQQNGPIPAMVSGQLKVHESRTFCATSARRSTWSSAPLPSADT